MNFSLELDGTLKVVQDNVTGCVQGINEMGFTNSDLTQKIVKLYELNAYLSKRIVENANHLKGNASKLTVSSNLLETELRQVTTNYNRLESYLTNQLKSFGDIESQAIHSHKNFSIIVSNLFGRCYILCYSLKPNSYIHILAKCLDEPCDCCIFWTANQWCTDSLLIKIWFFGGFQHFSCVDTNTIIEKGAWAIFQMSKTGIWVWTSKLLH